MDLLEKRTSVDFGEVVLKSCFNVKNVW